MPSFSIPLTGLEANSVALDTIGNNLANLNSTAFKRETVNFADLFYAGIGSNGSGQEMQVGVGTRVSSIDTHFDQGNLATTSDPSNVAINGNGFFMVKSPNAAPQLTRDGTFHTDTLGNLVTSSGAAVLGFGILGNPAAGAAALQPIQIPIGSTELAQATSNFSLKVGLDASAAVGSSFSTSEVMYDSLGQTHTVNVSFTKTAANQWNYSLNLPAGEAAAATGNTGTLTFNPDGSLATPAGNVTGIAFTGLTDGASDLTLNWQLRDGTGSSQVTQTVGASNASASTQDGFASGNYQNFYITSNGLVNVVYSNGHSKSIGQLALASVPNPEGLLHEGGNLYTPGFASGQATVGIAGTGQLGSITDNAIEQSNVDISTEFSDLIIAQRSFEANSKTVTAFDTVSQDTINMIR